MKRASTILDDAGNPFILNGTSEGLPQNVNGIVPSRILRFMGGGDGGSRLDIQDIVESLMYGKEPIDSRTTNPFQNHPWVFASAFMTALVSSQAPFTIFRETDEEIDKRERLALKRGEKAWSPPRGPARRACVRHLRKSVQNRILTKAAEPDFDHPLMEVFTNPNPTLTGNQLFWLIDLWMAIRGGVFLYLSNEDGSPAVGSMPAQIWPLSPDIFKPVFERKGGLVAWEIKLPSWLKSVLGLNTADKMVVPEGAVLPIKLPHPANPMRPLSRLAASSGTLNEDFLIGTYNQSLLKNDGTPKGVVMQDGIVLTPKEQEELELGWKENFEGPDKANRTAFLGAGIKYVPIGLSPQQLSNLDGKKWNRETVLAQLGTPPSTLGITDFVNYATQLGQDKNLWDKCIIPMKRVQEEALDSSTLFFTEPDTIYGGFLYNDVEALRVGLLDMANTATALCGTALHVTPRIAFNLVGLEVPEYEGIDDCLVPSGLATVEAVLSGDTLPKEPVDPEADPDEDPKDEDEEVTPAEDEDPETPEEGETDPATEASATPGRLYTVQDIKDAADAARFYTKARRASVSSKWKNFIKLENTLESNMKRAWRGWVADEKRGVLQDFDREASKVSKSLLVRVKAMNLDAVLPKLIEASKRIRSKTRKSYKATLDGTYELTVKEEFGGISVFEIDDPLLQNAFEKRQIVLADSAPKTLIKRLRMTLEAGLKNDETIQQLRSRIGEVFNISASSAKALQIARTETASLMNELRNGMFRLANITKEIWGTANDEVVRESHVVFGDAGEQEIGFNYMDLSPNGGGGTLEFPGDSRAPLIEIVNCRCFKTPA